MARATRAKILAVGPCEAQPACPKHCEAWEPHPTFFDVWQTCFCGHSRDVHAPTAPPAPLPPPEPARCPTCGQPLPEETADAIPNNTNPRP